LRVSVIIPVYNAEKFLPSTIESVLIQKEVGEVLLINDASTDRSKEIILDFAQRDARIRYFENDTNKWAGYTRNVGIENATCEYISFLDADDLFLERRFVDALNYLDNNQEIDGTYEDVKNIKMADFRSAHFEHQEIIRTPHGITSDLLFDYIAGEKGDFFHIISLVLRRDRCNKIRFDESFRVGQDIEYSYQVAKYLKFIHLNKSISIQRRLHDSNITSSNHHKEFKDRLKLIKKWYGKVKTEDFTKSSARSIVIRYIHHLYLERGGSKTNLFRIFVKAWYLFLEILKIPRLLWKIM
jgi:glycosyltransferase involved in cell wall biosynthesis